MGNFKIPEKGDSNFQKWKMEKIIVMSFLLRYVKVTPGRGIYLKRKKL